MPTNYPTSFDTFVDPSGTTFLNDVVYDHAKMHTHANDSIAALEQFIGLSGAPNFIPTGTVSGATLIGETESSGNTNTTLGYGALNVTTVGTTDSTGTINSVAIGYQALQSISFGGTNVAIGFQALKFNTTSSQNVAIGSGSMFNSTTSNDVAIGLNTLANDAGGNNTAIGTSVMGANTNGSNNIGIGYQALFHSNNGSSNTAVGANALFTLTNGGSNVAIGYTANNTMATNSYTLAIGAGTSTSADGAGAIGVDHTGAPATSSTQDLIVIGTSNHTVNVPGTLKVTAKQVATIIENINTVGTSGAAQTIPDVTTDTMNRITLTANCTLTFPTAAAGKSFTLALVQDATGSRTVTWPGTIKWSGGTTPTLTTTASKVDTFSFVCYDGTNWIGYTTGTNF